MSKMTRKMPMWFAENYIGERYDDYYVLAARTRDSGALVNSNFEACLKEIGGEKPPTIMVVRANHWLYGWVEQLIIDGDIQEAVDAGNEIFQRLLEYPVLDEDDYSRRITEARESHRKEIVADNDHYNQIVEAYGSLDNYLDRVEHDL